MSDWVRRWIADHQSRFHSEHNAPPKLSSDKLFHAVLAGDIETARAESVEANSGQDLDAVVCSVVEQVCSALANDQIDMKQAVGAFITVEKLLAHRNQFDVRQASKKGRLLVTTPNSEQHNFGVHILSYHLSVRGLAVETLLKAPQDQLMHSLANQCYDGLAISVGYDANLLGLADLISMTRVASRNSRLKVFVGGQVINRDTSEYEFLGADLIVCPKDDFLAKLEAYLLAPRLV